MTSSASARAGVPLAIGGLLAMAAAMGIGRFVFTPILPGMMRDLGLSAGEAGVIASANFLGYLAGALAAATPWLTGGRGALLLALGASAATTAATAAFSGVASLAVVRFAGGVASAFTLVFASALVLQRLVAAGRPGLSAVHFAGVGTGIALSALLVAALTAGGAGWRTLWLAAGGVSALAVPAVLALVPSDSAGARAAAAPSPYRPDATFLRLLTAYGLFGFGYVITATFIVALVRMDTALQPVEPYVWLVFGLAAAPSVWLWTVAARRWGTGPVFRAALGVEAIGVALSVAGGGTVPVLASAILLGGTFMGLTALGIAAGRHRAGATGQRAVALLTASFGLGQVIGPLFAGVLRDATGSFAAPTLAAAAVLIGAAIITPKL